jgi:hypothetical protein
MKKIYIEIRYFFRQLFTGFKNLWKWFPIIWKDRDWDDAFIFNVLKFKLQNTADELERAAFFVGYEHEVSRIRMCIKLINLIQEEYYELEYFDYEWSTFEFVPTGELDENGKDKFFEMKSQVFEDKLDDYFVKYPLAYKRVIQKIGYDDSRRIRIAIHIGRDNHERAKRLLFNTLSKHIENWWN